MIIPFSMLDCITFVYAKGMHEKQQGAQNVSCFFSNGPVFCFFAEFDLLLLTTSRTYYLLNAFTKDLSFQ